MSTEIVQFRPCGTKFEICNPLSKISTKWSFLLSSGFLTSNAFFPNFNKRMVTTLSILQITNEMTIFFQRYRGFHFRLWLRKPHPEESLIWHEVPDIKPQFLAAEQAARGVLMCGVCLIRQSALCHLHSISVWYSNDPPIPAYQHTVHYSQAGDTQLFIYGQRISSAAF